MKRNTKNIKKVFSEKAPKPIGPYSQGVVAGNFVFVSGQIGIQKTTNSLPESFEEEVEIAILNAIEILKAAGSSPDKVVKTTLYITDLEKFSTVNEIYTKYFGKNEIPPARETIIVKALPKNANFEISLIATL